MFYRPGLPQKLIAGSTDEVGLGGYEGNEVSLRSSTHDRAREGEYVFRVKVEPGHGLVTVVRRIPNATSALPVTRSIQALTRGRRSTPLTWPTSTTRPLNHAI